MQKKIKRKFVCNLELFEDNMNPKELNEIEIIANKITSDKLKNHISNASLKGVTFGISEEKLKENLNILEEKVKNNLKERLQSYGPANGLDEFFNLLEKNEKNKESAGNLKNR